jgi:hypothetical protein
MLLLAGCAYKPLIDPKTSRHPENYDTDLAECRALARGEPGAGAGAAVGAAGGAIVGAAVASATGRGEHAGRAAGGGAVVGAAGGAGRGARGQRGIVRNCMQGRGYSVLN